MNGARTVAGAVRRCIHLGEQYPWPDYLVRRLTLAHYRSRIADQRDYALIRELIGKGSRVRRVAAEARGA